MRLISADPPRTPITIFVDGTPLPAYPGDTIASALYAAGVRAWRRARSGDARGLLCGMGACFDCLVTVDGRANVRACQQEAADGMRVETSLAPGSGGQPGQPGEQP